MDLRKKLESNNELIQLVGIHNPLGAIIAKEAGFDGAWLSGLELSASCGVPDINIISQDQVLKVASSIIREAKLPLIVDCDNGYGDVKNIIYLIRAFESANVDGVCVEDKIFPKSNSLLQNGKHSQNTIEEFASKVVAATRTKENKAFIFIARIESFICKSGLEDALHRAKVYCAAGADVLLIHSNKKNSDEIKDFMKLYKGDVPIAIVPTTYSSITKKEIKKLGIRIVIYANQGLRASTKALRETFSFIKNSNSAFELDERIDPVDEIFRLQNLYKFVKHEEEYNSISKALIYEPWESLL